MQRVGYLVFASGLVFSAPAFAQDIFPETADWNGFYLGALGGGAWADFEGESTGAAGGGGGAPIVIEYGDFSFDDGSGLVGITGGFNRQFGRFVLGVAADGMFADLGGSQSFSVPAGGGAITGDVGAAVDGLGVFRGTAGITNGPFMFYGTAGVAIGEIDAAVGVNAPVAPPPVALAQAPLPQAPGSYDFYGEGSETGIGIALGAGVAAQITPHVVVDLSYLFVNFDEEFEFDLQATNGGTAIVGTADVDFSAHLGRLGVAFKF